LAQIVLKKNASCPKDILRAESGIPLASAFRYLGLNSETKGITGDV